ncbi:hypothetical protein N7466_006321 [Penicillium verhagenii]|uniref:uncharacterized protein n=1 Tax=Penicillium verhagenii TaxID=1562060 RepID=UPI002544F8C5|nr:uncharacterized protein N7466_006321 [Penicillium verhagenii]KAJ5930828.1 hypothetical protein N7466_006321 [Penicillium verhagenii]
MASPPYLNGLAARGSNGNDIKAAFIESYLEDLGPMKAAIGNCALVLACQLALEGGGPPGLKDEVIATIGWQATQIQQVGQLEHLGRQGLITDVVDEDDEVDEEALFQLLADDRDIVEPVSERLNKIDTLKNMVSSPDEGHVPVFFGDGKKWLIENLEYNRRMYPDSFDLDRVLEEAPGCLASWLSVCLAVSSCSSSI